MVVHTEPRGAHRRFVNRPRPRVGNLRFLLLHGIFGMNKRELVYPDFTEREADDISASEPPKGLRKYVPSPFQTTGKGKVASVDATAGPSVREVFAVADQNFRFFIRKNIEREIPRAFPTQISDKKPIRQKFQRKFSRLRRFFQARAFNFFGGRIAFR